MPVVKMPDGHMVDMPDDPTPEQLDALRKVAEPQGFVDNAIRAGKNVARGAGDAALSALDGLFGSGGLDAKAYTENYQKTGQRDPSLLKPQVNPIIQKGRELLDEFLPKDPNPGYKSAIAEGVGGGLMAPGSLASRVITGGASGAGAEAAGKLSDNNPWARLLGGLAGGLGTGALMNKVTRVSPRTEEIGKEILEGVSPQDLAKAKELMLQAKKQGVNLTLGQALEKRTNVNVVEDALANNRHGNLTQKTFRNQPSQVKTLSETMIDRLPGEIQNSPSAAANDLQSAATDTIAEARKQRGDLWQETFKRADQNRQVRLENVVKGRAAQVEEAKANFGKTLDRYTKSVVSDALKPGSADVDGGFKEVIATGGKAQETAKALEKSLEKWKSYGTVPAAQITQVRNSLLAKARKAANTAEGGKYQSMADSLLNAEGKPITDVDNLLKIHRDWRDSVANTNIGTPSASATVAGAAKTSSGQLRDVVTANNMPTAVANKVYSEFTTGTLEPLKKSVVGRVAGKTGATPDTEAPLTKMETLFNKGSDPRVGAKSDILTLAKELKKTNPNAFPNAVKTHLSKKIADTLESSGDGQLSEKTAESLRNALFKSESQRQGIRDMVAGSARSLNKSDVAAVRGFENLMRVVDAASVRPKTVGGLQRNEVMEMGGKSYGADALRVFGFMPFEKAAHNIESHLMGRTFRNLDKIVATPEGVDTLIKISKLPPKSPQIEQLMQSFLGAEATADE